MSEPVLDDSGEVGAEQAAGADVDGHGQPDSSACTLQASEEDGTAMRSPCGHRQPLSRYGTLCFRSVAQVNVAFNF